MPSAVESPIRFMRCRQSMARHHWQAPLWGSRDDTKSHVPCALLHDQGWNSRGLRAAYVDDLLRAGNLNLEQLQRGQTKDSKWKMTPTFLPSTQITCLTRTTSASSSSIRRIILISWNAYLPTPHFLCFDLPEWYSLGQKTLARSHSLYQ